MSFYHIYFEQKIPQSLDVVWDFIANPKNLALITPPSMGLDITSKDLPEKIYTGMIISYIIKPLFGLKMLWLTEIKHLKEREYFVDEQRAGPYKLWHHQHKLTQFDGYVLMSDIVTYKPPYGLLGTIANSLVIRNKLDEIFRFRKEALEKKFGKIA